MSSAVIVSAKRTPIGTFMGSLAPLSAVELGATAIAAALKQIDLDPATVDDVVMGHILSAAQGQNTARQAAMGAGIPHQTTGMTINQLCGSGLRAVAMAAQAIQLGDASVVVAGGQESMSTAPHAAEMRAGKRLGDLNFADTMIKDGLWCAFNDYHMGTTAENIATRYGISREDQDRFAASSQQRAAAAQQAGRFAGEMAPVTIKGRKGETIVEADEYPRASTTIESLAALRPAFTKDGTVTAGNASGLNDGAAALVVMSEAEAMARDLTPLARIASWATAGVDPAVMGTGPIPASNKALAKAGWTIPDLDLIESNEAFAAQSLAVIAELGLDPARVNVNGGAIALGHPIGASGARVLTTLLYEMQRRAASKGLATLCIGGGMGVAVCVER